MTDNNRINNTQIRKKLPTDIKKAHHRIKHPFVIKTKHKQLILIPAIVVLAIIAIVMIIVFI